MAKSQPQNANRKDVIPIGALKGGRSRAWWSLSHRAKQILQREREAGRFGGIPGKAPYWQVQDQGSAGADVEPQFYLERGLEKFHAASRSLVRNFLRVP